MDPGHRTVVTSGRRAGGARAARGVLAVAIVLAALAVLGAPAAAASSAAAPGEEGSFPGCPLLLEGQTSDCVRRLQINLNIVNPAYELPGTRTFGVATRRAVLDFQGRNSLPADGNVGRITADLLRAQVRQVQADPSDTGTTVVEAPEPPSQFEQCQELGRRIGVTGLVGAGPGKCTPDAAISTKSPEQCVGEIVSKKAGKLLKEKLAEGKSQEQAERESKAEAEKTRVEAEKEASKAKGAKKVSLTTLKAIAKRGSTVASLYKCMFFDVDEPPTYSLN